MKQKVIMLKTKFKLNISGIIKKIADCRNDDTAAIQETPDIQLEELMESEPINLNLESDCH